MVQLIGKGKAMELLMSAHMIDANEAKQLGLVNYVTTAETLLEHTKKILELINHKAPLAVAGCIKAANAVFDETKDGYALEIEEFGNAFVTEDMKEGLRLSWKKEKPVLPGDNLIFPSISHQSGRLTPLTLSFPFASSR